MNLTATQRFSKMTARLGKKLKLEKGGAYTLVIILALAGFELFNFSTTRFALSDMLGDFGGTASWPVVLALAFCAMDMAGIARILSAPDAEAGGRSGWYLLGAWAVAGAMNAGLTWWGISVAVYNQPAHDVLLVDPMTYVTLVPVIVAVLVWVIRVLIIGALVTSVEKADAKKKVSTKRRRAFGFQGNEERIPPGYQPMPSRAELEKKGFPM